MHTPAFECLLFMSSYALNTKAFHRILSTCQPRLPITGESHHFDKRHIVEHLLDGNHYVAQSNVTICSHFWVDRFRALSVKGTVTTLWLRYFINFLPINLCFVKLPSTPS